MISNFNRYFAVLCILLSSSLNAWGQVVFHGSPVRFPAPVPMENKSFQAGKIVWVGSGVFASPDLRVAIAYTADRFPDQAYSFEVELVRKIPATLPLKLTLYGGRDKEDALEKLYGSKKREKRERRGLATGYIYCMDGGEFLREEGLGKMEWVTRRRPKLIKSQQCPNGTKVINRRAALDRLVRLGLVKTEWARLRDLKH